MWVMCNLVGLYIHAALLDSTIALILHACLHDYGKTSLFLLAIARKILLCVIAADLLTKDD